MNQEICIRITQTMGQYDNFLFFIFQKNLISVCIGESVTFLSKDEIINLNYISVNVFDVSHFDKYDMTFLGYFLCIMLL